MRDTLPLAPTRDFAAPILGTLGLLRVEHATLVEARIVAVT